ncbi:LysM peptidoglycan-binding domain-containing protein [Apilactobacillus apinorum]|uniref:LysM domain-containing protein n=1 Tax=Apilactobacillus apinorum TaxID=1218495 RepID=A0ABP9ZHY0_9LACO
MLFATTAVAGLFIASGATANADQTANSQTSTNTTNNTAVQKVTVQNGDTLWGLSQKYNVSLDSLRKANDRVDTDLIYVGEKLTLPSDATVDSQTEVQSSTATNASQPAAQTSTTTTTSTYTGNNSDAKAWIANRESSGSYTAQNGQYYGKYQLSASMLNGDYSAANQERVADQYVASRYGSWDNAKAFWLQHGWY